MGKAIATPSPAVVSVDEARARSALTQNATVNARRTRMFIENPTPALLR